jgi:hypothetical protein
VSLTRAAPPRGRATREDPHEGAELFRVFHPSSAPLARTCVEPSRLFAGNLAGVVCACPTSHINTKALLPLNKRKPKPIFTRYSQKEKRHDAHETAPQGAVTFGTSIPRVYMEFAPPRGSLLNVKERGSARSSVAGGAVVVRGRKWWCWW